MVECVAPADDPVAAAVENFLVADGIPSDIITADHGNYHSMRIMWGDDLTDQCMISFK